MDSGTDNDAFLLGLLVFLNIALAWSNCEILSFITSNCSSKCISRSKTSFFFIIQYFVQIFRQIWVRIRQRICEIHCVFIMRKLVSKCKCVIRLIQPELSLPSDIILIIRDILAVSIPLDAFIDLFIFLRVKGLSCRSCTKNLVYTGWGH